ncbi:hypothetical protein [Psychroserpens sp.]|uniref:hypothetical protein n=1 Tax=Psychroserpens sp. TaxID=2020870 RepID=UPI003C75B258
MHNQQLANEINSLKETIESLMMEIQYLRNDLEKTRDESEGLRFRMSELESALGRD